MSSIVDEHQRIETPSAVGKRPGWGWQRAQAAGALAIVVTLGLLMVHIGAIEPFALIPSIPFVVALLVRLRFRRTGTVLIGVFAVLLLVMNAPFLIDELQHLSAGLDYAFPIFVLAGTATALGSTIPAYKEIKRGASGSLGARVVPAAAGALALVLSIVALAANARYDSAVAQPGDVKVEARDYEFATKKIVADGGEVTVYVENTGEALHSFTIDELGINEYIPAGKATRITFTAEPGTYRFYCNPHAPDMEGSLTVR